MLSLFGRCIGASTVVCVLLMFFFPLPHGNFQSTHGPTTALRARRGVLTLVFSILNAALQILAVLNATFLPARGRRLWGGTQGLELCGVSSHNSILRC